MWMAARITAIAYSQTDGKFKAVQAGLADDGNVFKLAAI